MMTPPETQARLAAEMARMMGLPCVQVWERDAPMVLYGAGCARVYKPFDSADDAIAFADWAEMMGHIYEWSRGGPSPYVAVYETYAKACADLSLCEEITPDCPFPAALTLAVCRAIEPLRRILEDGDGE